MPHIKGPFNPAHIPLNIRITCFKCNQEVVRGTWNHTFNPSKFIPPSEVATKRYAHKVCSTEPNFNGFKEQTPPPSAVKEPTPATQPIPHQPTKQEQVQSATGCGPVQANDALNYTNGDVAKAIDRINNPIQPAPAPPSAVIIIPAST